MTKISYSRPVGGITHSHAIIINVLTEEECRAVIEIGESLLPQESRVANGQTQENVRKSKVAFILPKDAEWLFERIADVAGIVNDASFQMELKHFGEIQFTKYETGCFYDWHMDLIMGLEQHPNAQFSRKLSMSLLISPINSYEGGELVIGRTVTGDALHTIGAQQGAAVFFPSFLDHKVNSVTSGTRYSLVCWFGGDKYK